MRFLGFFGFPGLFGVFPFLDLEGEALFFESEKVLPVLVTDGVFADGLDVAKTAAEGAFGLRFVAVEEVEPIETLVGPEGRGFIAGVEMEFVVRVGADAARENPAGVDGLGDEIGSFGGAGLVMSEGVVKVCEEDSGVFFGEKEGFG